MTLCFPWPTLNSLPSGSRDNVGSTHLMQSSLTVDSIQLAMMSTLLALLISCLLPTANPSTLPVLLPPGTLWILTTTLPLAPRSLAYAKTRLPHLSKNGLKKPLVGATVALTILSGLMVVSSPTTTNQHLHAMDTRLTKFPSKDNVLIIQSFSNLLRLNTQSAPVCLSRRSDKPPWSHRTGKRRLAKKRRP